MCQFSTTTWSGFDCTIDRQNYREIVPQKFVATDVMLGIYSLIWTICHKLMWFYRNAVIFHIIFVVTHGEIFGHLGHTGPLTVNKMALPLMYRRRWRHIHAFIGKNMIALRVQRFAAGANIICLTYATDWWAAIDPVIHGESKSQATRSSSDHVGLLRTLSTIDTQKSKLGVRLVLEVFAKLMVGENSSWEFPKVRVRLILEVWLILETRRYALHFCANFQHVGRRI